VLLAASLTAATCALVTGSAGATGASGAFSVTQTVQRTMVENGSSSIVESRRFHLTVDQTRNLRNRQEITVTWSGAHPTGGVALDENSSVAATQEYPVVVMMCRGAPSQVGPATCWTATPSERAQSSSDGSFPPYRVDQYATVADRAPRVGVPNPLPSACNAAGASSGVQHWVPFVAASRQTFGYGLNGCAGLPPEATITDGSLPSNTAYAATHLDGTGRTNFVITTDESNTSLGCSQRVACSLVVIPIMGISCDPEAFGLPAQDQPPTPQAVQRAKTDCESTGNYPPGSIAPSTPSFAVTVSGQLWWSASNWRNRISVPLTFAPPDNACALITNSVPEAIYGSPLLTQATTQWAPHFCTNAKLFDLHHVITSEPQAKNLLRAGTISAAFQAVPPQTPYARPVVQAPTAFTGFAVVYKIDDKNGFQYFNLRLNARLLAKLLSESYPANPSLRSEYTALARNPVDLPLDPEFRALNPGLPQLVTNSDAASTILTLSSESDTTWALTSYINADPAARAFLNGTPDPWGMVVNPAYKHIKLPVTDFPLLDKYRPQAFYTDNPCLRPTDPAQKPLPYLPLVANPVQSQALITLEMQYDKSNAQITCVDTNPPPYLTALGREVPGQRFLLGITSLGDAFRYALPVASLQTSGPDDGQPFTTAAGRTFAGPTAAGLRAAVKSLVWSAAARTWVLPYQSLARSVTGRAAYPGSVLVSTDVPTVGLSPSDAKNYANFLGFAVTTGQTPGFDTGNLPPGFLPLTASNGFADEIAYTKAAVTAVAVQRGQLPDAHGILSRGIAGGGSTGGSGGGASGAGFGSGGASVGAGSSSGAGGSSGPRSAAASGTAGKGTGTGSPMPASSGRRQLTIALSASAWGAAALPLIGLVAIAALLATVLLSLRRRGGA
jgi:hypothetical protein